MEREAMMPTTGGITERIRDAIAEVYAAEPAPDQLADQLCATGGGWQRAHSQAREPVFERTTNRARRELVHFGVGKPVFT
jgi:hypothetical protein